MQTVAVIPARYGSSRLPGKPLLRETGRWLIQHVCEQVEQSRLIEAVFVATDDARIVEAVASFGGRAILTRADHASGTDRICEALEQIPGDDDQLVVNVQGDEPEIEPAALDALIERMRAEPELNVGTVAAAFPAGLDPDDPSAVKVVLDERGRALYFSRARIPHPRDLEPDDPVTRPLLHVGVYAYRRAFLRRFASWPPGALERIEKLEQLRILERGEPIAVVRVQRAGVGIDTPQDYARFVARWRATHEASRT